MVPLRLENGRAPRGGEERDAAGLGMRAFFLSATQTRTLPLPSPRIELGPARHFAFIFASFFAEVTFFAFFFLPRARVRRRFRRCRWCTAIRPPMTRP